MKSALFKIFVCSLTLSAGILAPARPSEAGSLAEALTSGKVSLDTRYRYEWVDQAGTPKQAHGSTLRSRLGYRTAAYKGVMGFLEFEDISVIGNEQYNDTKNGKTQYPVVADPEDTELNQAYLQYQGSMGVVLTGGRQRIKLDNDRFIGNVGWRQNEQTFDAMRLALSPVAGLSGTYIHLANVNQIFGAHHPTAALADTRMNSHLIHLAYAGTPAFEVSAYGYFLDFENTPAASHQTLGIRLKGKVPVGQDAKLLYTVEYADQGDYADGLTTNDADYFLGELGGSMNALTAKVGYEVLSGDGTYGFATPLATAHAFQGWADKFLATPATGVEDLYFTLTGKVAGFKLVGVYHIFTSDSSGFDYGTETDLLIVKPITKNYLLSVKYANYDADRNANNTGGTAVDVEKLWFTAEVKF